MTIAWASLPAHADSPIESAKVYVGPEGVEVAVLLLKPRSGGKALIQVTGSGGDLDGKVLLYNMEEYGSNLDFTTKFRGRSFVTVAAREHAGERRFRLHLPRHASDILLAYDEKKSKALQSDEVYKRYQKQSTDGTLAALQKFDRKAEMAEQEKQLAQEVDAFNKSCRSKVAFRIAWSTISDDLLQKLSITSYCSAVPSALQSLCSNSEEARSTVQTKVKTVLCQFGPKMALDLDGKGTVTWTTSKDAYNQTEFARKTLENKL